MTDNNIDALPPSSNACPGGCFLAGTLVHTKEGLKPVEQIQVGDWVLSKPEIGDGEPAYKRVTRTVSHEDKEIWIVEISNVGDVDEKGMVRSVKRILGTPDHPFWVHDKGWTALRTLELYDRVTLTDGAEGRVFHVNILYKSAKSENLAFDYRAYDVRAGVILDLTAPDFEERGTRLKRIDIPDHVVCDYENPATYFRAKVFNFEVEDFHTYFVGSLGVLVGDASLAV